jgi:hypothetical protein
MTASKPAQPRRTKSSGLLRAIDTFEIHVLTVKDEDITRNLSEADAWGLFNRSRSVGATVKLMKAGVVLAVG